MGDGDCSFQNHLGQTSGEFALVDRFSEESPKLVVNLEYVMHHFAGEAFEVVLRNASRGDGRMNRHTGLAHRSASHFDKSRRYGGAEISIGHFYLPLLPAPSTPDHGYEKGKRSGVKDGAPEGSGAVDARFRVRGCAGRDLLPPIFYRCLPRVLEEFPRLRLENHRCSAQISGLVYRSADCLSELWSGRVEAGGAGSAYRLVGPRAATTTPGLGGQQRPFSDVADQDGVGLSLAGRLPCRAHSQGVGMGWFSGKERQQAQEREIARLREHNAQLQARVAELEAENARLVSQLSAARKDSHICPERPPVTSSNRRASAGRRSLGDGTAAKRDIPSTNGPRLLPVKSMSGSPTACGTARSMPPTASSRRRGRNINASSSRSSWSRNPSGFLSTRPRALGAMTAAVIIKRPCPGTCSRLASSGRASPAWPLTSRAAATPPTVGFGTFSRTSWASGFPGATSPNCCAKPARPSSRPMGKERRPFIAIGSEPRLCSRNFRRPRHVRRHGRPCNEKGDPAHAKSPFHIQLAVRQPSRL